jgi:imidazolonepropionase-like amidohydrolase
MPAAQADASESRESPLRSLADAIADAKAYRLAREADPTRAVDARWEAMQPVLAGERPIVVAADDIQQIQAAVAFAQQHRLKLILYGGYDAELSAVLLKSQQIPVIIGGVHRLPRRRSDAYDAAFTLPERLRAAGVKFCISGQGALGASNVRNLPYHAATAVAYGLPADEALKSITLYPAQILGVADKVGSLAPGNDATLIITDGDPLETMTQVEIAFIQGRPVDLDDRHKSLWRKYQKKYNP